MCLALCGKENQHPASYSQQLVGEHMDVQWSNNGVPAVREALDAFIAELE